VRTGHKLALLRADLLELAGEAEEHAAAAYEAAKQSLDQAERIAALYDRVEQLETETSDDDELRLEAPA
jgi:hypothetical protein